MYYVVVNNDGALALCTPNSILLTGERMGLVDHIVKINKKQKEFIEYIFDKELFRYSIILN